MTWSRRPPCGPAGHSWVNTWPSGMVSPGWSRCHWATTYGTSGIRLPRMNDSPAASICFWLASLTIPASATTVTSGGSCAAMNDSITGSMVLVQGADVVEDQARPAQPGVRGARRGQLLPERVLGIGGKAALERGIRRAGQADLLQHPQAVG